MKRRTGAALFIVAEGAIISAGSALRIYDLLRPYSLWADEAKLALNVISRPLRGLLVDALAYRQMAPPGYLALERLSVDLFGPSEVALRLLPALSGIAVLLLAWWLVRALRLDRRVGLVFLAMLAISPYLVLYSEMDKQYSTGAALVLGVLVAFARFRNRPSVGRGLALGILGGLAPWFADGSFFVLCGVLAVLVWMVARGGARAKAVLYAACLTLLGVVPAALFALRVDGPIRAGMDAYWRHGFLPFPPRSPSDLSAYLRAGIALFAHPGGMQGMPWLGAAAFFLGCAFLLERDRSLVGMLVVPLFVLMGAAALRVFPVGGDGSPVSGRVVLWVAPLLLLGCSYGAVRLATRRPWVARVTGVLLIAAMLFDAGSRLPEYRTLFRGLSVRRAARVVAEDRDPREPVYTTGLIWSPLEYYAGRMGLRHVGLPLARVADTLSAHRRIWVLHYASQPVPARFRPDSLGRTLARLSVPGVRGFLVQLDPSARPRS